MCQFFGDSDDDTLEENHQRKRTKGRPKPSPQPLAPAVPPPCHVPSSSTVVPPQPTSLIQMECRRPAEQQTPSAGHMHTSNWRRGRLILYGYGI
ncbi:hypothetical protein AMECASPLE_035124 [Ameca splendens]|uniref:Uncharacterized protein n=1 Tax=Ameca splendens TaxID=208324 RepID=A0ABV0ZS79_9TELE